MERNSNQLNIRVEEEIKKEFIQKAKENGTTATDLLVAYMKQYLGRQTKGSDELLSRIEMLERNFSSFQEEMTSKLQVAVGE